MTKKFLRSTDKIKGAGEEIAKFVVAASLGGAFSYMIPGLLELYGLRLGWAVYIALMIICSLGVFLLFLLFALLIRKGGLK